MRVSKILKIAYDDLSESVIRQLSGAFGRKLRYSYYKKRLKHLGQNVVIDENVIFSNPQCISIGNNSWIDHNVILLAGDTRTPERKDYFRQNKNFRGEVGDLTIGKNCHIAPNVVIQAHAGVSIGDCVGVASGSKIYSVSHHYRNLEIHDGILYKFTPKAPMNEQYLIRGPIVMEDNTALGLNSTMLPGVTIHKNSWVGVNSFVIRDIPANSIAKGNPIKITKR